MAPGVVLTLTIPGNGGLVTVLDQDGRELPLHAPAPGLDVLSLPGPSAATDGPVLGPGWIDFWVLTPDAIGQKLAGANRRFGQPTPTEGSVDVYRKTLANRNVVIEERYDRASGLPTEETVTYAGQVLSVARHGFAAAQSGAHHRVSLMAESRLQNGTRMIVEHRLSEVNVTFNK
jgi:hypothetical protein